jgi:hypothetical protein
MRLLGIQDRISIVGRTGSGKTVGAGFHALAIPIEDMPLLIYNFKGDELIEQIGEHPEVKHITTAQFPDGPGVWIVNPLPGEEDRVEEQLWRVWARRYTAVWFDEGYMITGSKAYRAILTQGRSLRIPAISVSQRPVWMDVFSFTEATYFHVYDLVNAADRKKMMEYVPADLSKRLPAFYSYHHDVPEAQTEILRPVPPPDEIVRRFHGRLDAMKPKRKIVVL